MAQLLVRHTHTQICEDLIIIPSDGSLLVSIDECQKVQKRHKIRPLLTSNFSLYF